ncbi:MAG TPA: DUF2249 domain-containing protein [Candidatus Limnocylindrales bacterium]|nr:DUF2249 domain-containing protein [Candidatus Limnocylindrales bacterium]
MFAQTIPLGPPAAVEFNACGVEHDTVRHDRPFQSIFDALDALRTGEAVRLAVDHDPEPLLASLEARRPGGFRWEPLLTGPIRWVGLIRRVDTGLPHTARALSPRLVRRVDHTRARARLEDQLRSIALDLLGPSDRELLPAESAAWVEEAADRAVEAVRDASLTVLVERLEASLAAAPPTVAERLEEATERQEAGIV